MRTRREFIKLGSLAGARLLMPWQRGLGQSTPPVRWPSSPVLAKYVDPVSFPSVLAPAGTLAERPYYEVAASEFYQLLHRDLPPTKVWGYGDARKPKGEYPGPTLQAHRGQPIKIRYRNRLPTRHLLPVDRSLRGTFYTDAQGRCVDSPEVRLVTHLHGGHVPPQSDGHPNAWISSELDPAGQRKGPQYAADSNQDEIYDYPNDQRATLMWYHDHALGITRLNTYAGLAGFYVLRDNFEDDLIASECLPGIPGVTEIPLMIQDKIFNSDGSLWYPDRYDPGDLGPGVPADGSGLPSPSCVPEFFGDAILVNGKIWPYLEIEPRQYRFRILNGSPSRFYRLKLYQTDRAGTMNRSPLTGKPTNPPGPSFLQIGTEGGFLNVPVSLNVSFLPNPLKLMLAPAERADLLIDFSGHAGQNFVLWNDAVEPFPSGILDPATQPVMQIRVKNVRPIRPNPLPRLPVIPRLLPWTARVKRNLILSEAHDDYGRLIQRLGTLSNGHGGFAEAVTESSKAGSIEVLNLINTTMDAHPIHTHLFNFQVLFRQEFDMPAYATKKQIVFAGPEQPPELNELGWKETVKASPGKTDPSGTFMVTGMMTTLIATLDAPDKWANTKGEYMWHGQIPEQEDHDMMRRFRLIKT